MRFRNVIIAAVLQFMVLLFPGTSLFANSGEEPVQSLQGKPLVEVLQAFSEKGVNLLFSTNYIRPAMMVVSEPVSRDPVHAIDEILEPHQLKLKYLDGNYLVVRDTQDISEAKSPSLLVIIRNPGSLGPLENLLITTEPEIGYSETHGPGLYEFFPTKPGEYVIDVQLPGYTTNRSTTEIGANGSKALIIELEKGPTTLEVISVFASRYILFSSSQFIIDQRAIEILPHSGEDPIRAVHRLPGSAASGFSSKSHFRGGLLNESSIYLNGMKLLDPFHIRNFHSIFSSIDARAISTIQVYTGGPPIEYGDVMSGVMMLDAKAPEKPLQSELGLSMFYTSVLNSGLTKDDRYDWLVSARRSNLNLVLDPDYGDPEYFDVFATLGFNATPNTRISLNGLFTDDEIIILTEHNPDELEKSVGQTNSKTGWLRIESSWGSNLSADTSISTSYFSNKRVASVQDPNEMVANVFDFREVRVHGLRHSLQLDASNGHLLRWGLEFSRQSASYSYKGQAEYFGLAGNYPDIENPVAYQIETHPKGNAFAVFLSDRFEVNKQFSLELGLRWDKQTYTESNYSGQLSPRASMLYSIGNRRNLRLSFGRFYQAQRIQDLQVEDNIDHFFEPQYADQVIAGYQWTNSSDYEFRVEAYYKRYNRLAPRFENLFDPLQMVPEFQLDRVRLEPDSASTRGLEFSVEYVANENLSWWASYTLSRASDSINGRSQRRSWDQMHAFQFGLGWQKNAWEVGLAGRIHTGWPTTGLDVEFNSDRDAPLLTPGARNAEQYGTFASLDFRISRQFDVRIGQLSGFLEISNTTNRDNPCCTDYGIENSPDGSVSLNRKIEYWFPIIPSIGLLWEF